MYCEKLFVCSDSPRKRPFDTFVVSRTKNKTLKVNKYWDGYGGLDLLRKTERLIRVKKTELNRWFQIERRLNRKEFTRGRDTEMTECGT